MHSPLQNYGPTTERVVNNCLFNYPWDLNEKGKQLRIITTTSHERQFYLSGQLPIDNV
jgi:hypothetical protein